MALDPEHEKALRSYAVELGVSPDLAVAVGTQESGPYGEKARSAKGARGIMQVMPETSRELVKRYGPDLRRQGVGYLKELKQRFLGLPPEEQDNFMLAAYNAGPGKVARARAVARKKGLDPDRFDHVAKFLPKETRNYVPIVRSQLRPRETKPVSKGPRLPVGPQIQAPLILAPAQTRGPLVRGGVGIAPTP